MKKIKEMIRYINNKKTSAKGFEHLYSFDSHFLEIGSYKLHYLDEGRGKPVIMVHGNPTWSFYFRRLVSDLSGKYRTIVPDHMGCGLSDKPSCHEYDYTLKSRVNDLERLIDHLNLKDKITFIVHDWGGMIALSWALQNLGRIEKIVITNTSGFLLPKEKSFPLRLWLIKYFKVFAVPAVLGLNIFARAALYMAPKSTLSREVKIGLTAPYDSLKNRIATLKFVEDIPITDKDKSYEPVKYVDENLFRLKNIPMMILWGKHDFVFDLTFLNEWKRRFPEALFYLFEDAGHYLFEDKPWETSELIRQFMLQ